jgi:TrmH family RNA methyltransferase
MIPVTIILAEPEHPGNIGAVCRAMANFGFTNLVIINPRCDPKSQEVRNLAKHAQHLVDNARITGWDVLAEFSTVAATAGVLVTDYNLPRTPLTPEEGAAKLVAIKPGKSHRGAALLFGRESTGLRNDELARADYVITIPTTRAFPSINLAQSVTVMLYVLAQQKPVQRFTPLPRHEKDILLEKFDALLETLSFKTVGQRATQKKLWRSIIGRSTLTRREAFALFGFLSACDERQKTLSTPSTRRTRRGKR